MTHIYAYYGFRHGIDGGFVLGIDGEGKDVLYRTTDWVELVHLLGKDEWEDA